MNNTLRYWILPAVAAGTLATAVFQPAAAEPSPQQDRKQVFQEKIHERTQARLDRLAERLEIKSSQQAVWDEFAKSLQALAEHDGQRPGGDADASVIARYRADRAAELAGKLGRVADATAKLRTALNEDQRKTLDQVSRRFLRGQSRHANWRGHEFRGRGHAWSGRMD